MGRFMRKEKWSWMEEMGRRTLENLVADLWLARVAWSSCTGSGANETARSWRILSIDEEGESYPWEWAWLPHGSSLGGVHSQPSYK